MCLLTGRAVLLRDADLQDPPYVYVLLDLIAEWREGYDIVCAVRRRRAGESSFKRASATSRYKWPS